GYFVVEDGVVDDDALRISDDWPRGVRQALEHWLAGNPRFGRVPPPYIVTCHPGGFLRATARAEAAPAVTLTLARATAPCYSERHRGHVALPGRTSCRTRGGWFW